MPTRNICDITALIEDQETTYKAYKCDVDALEASSELPSEEGDILWPVREVLISSVFANEGEDDILGFLKENKSFCGWSNHWKLEGREK